MKLRTPDQTLSGIVLLICLVAGALSAFHDRARWSAALHDGATLETFLDGRISQEMARRLADSPFPQGVATVQRVLAWWLIGDLGPRVRQGEPGWLFLNDEWAIDRDAEQHAAVRAAIVRQVHADLARRGIALRLVIVPDKNRIAIDKLGSLRRPQAFADRVDAWIESLDGVPALSLAEPLHALGATAWLRTDSHWSEAGAQAAAAYIANWIRQQDVARSLPLDTLRLSAQPGPTEPVSGDLIRLAGLDGPPEPLRPRSDRIARSRIVETEAATSPEALDDDDLFGDAGLPKVVLLGTSFSRHSQFARFLEAALGLRLANHGQDGGGFSGAATAYFGSRDFRDTPPALVIWEIPERFLQVPLLEELGPAAATSAELPPAHTAR